MRERDMAIQGVRTLKRAYDAALKPVAEAHGLTKTGTAAAWILRHPAGMQILTGTMKVSRLEEIARAADVELTREEWYRLYRAAGHILP